MPISEMIQAAWPILLMLVIFYFLLYRPQKKQQNEREALLNNLKKGNKVVTIGGIYGMLTEVHEEYVMIKVADNMELKLSRTAIGKVL